MCRRRPGGFRGGGETFWRRKHVRHRMGGALSWPQRGGGTNQINDLLAKCGATSRHGRRSPDRALLDDGWNQAVDTLHQVRPGNATVVVVGKRQRSEQRTPDDTMHTVPWRRWCSV